MPLYEYECDACGHRFEKIRKFSDAPIEICPECGEHVRKLIASPAIQFKGSGFYITDYPKKDATGAGKAGEGSKNEDGAAKDTKDTKDTKGAAAKSETAPSASSADGAASTLAKAPAKD